MDANDLYMKVVQELTRIRKQAGLTQAEVAHRMRTVQASIARFENNAKGSFSLERYVAYAIACGYAPCNLCDVDEIRRGNMIVEFHCIPLEDARAFLIASPQTPMTWRNYIHWKTEAILKDLGPPQQYTRVNMLSCN